MSLTERQRIKAQDTMLSELARRLLPQDQSFSYEYDTDEEVFIVTWVVWVDGVVHRPTALIPVVDLEEENKYNITPNAQYWAEQLEASLLVLVSAT